MRSGFVIAALAAAPALFAQQRPVTSADYAHAERFLNYNVTPLVFGTAVRPTWLPDDRFWFRDVTPTGAELILVDPAHGTRTRCDTDPNRCGLNVAAEDQGGGRGRGGRGGGGVTGGRGRGANARAPETMSPDGKLGAFIRDWNLWVRDVATGRETQLTTDGVPDFGYATDNAGWTASDRAIVTWSPDSKKIATFQQDQRHVGEMYLVSTAVGHPELRAWKYPLPGDSVIPMISRVIIDLNGAAPKTIRLQTPPDAHRSTLCDHIYCGGGWADVEWYPDGSKLAFVSTSRDHRNAVLRVADAATGAVRDVLTETVPTQFESGNGKVNWTVLPASNELIWFSERSNWGQLYLYDLTTGALKRQITTGDGNVTQIVRVDDKARTIYFMGVGKTPGRDPYFRSF
jgi:hypothetical protein